MRDFDHLWPYLEDLGFNMGLKQVAEVGDGGVLLPDFLSLRRNGERVTFAVRLAEDDTTRSLLEGIFLQLRKAWDPDKKGLVEVIAAPNGVPEGFTPYADLIARAKA